MIVVIQCAASKRESAGYLLSVSGKPVIFVADPQAAPAGHAREYARPDDLNGNEISWRGMLLRYNEAGGNPLGLYSAWQLYKNTTYGRLVDRLGLQKVYILSAGWGLIRADFLTPYYDITFSRSADVYKQRRKGVYYQDFRMLPKDTEDEILFFGGKDYLPFFCDLTDRISADKTVFYNSTHPPKAPGCSLQKFETATRTNWHYECAKAFLAGSL